MTRRRRRRRGGGGYAVLRGEHRAERVDRKGGRQPRTEGERSYEKTPEYQQKGKEKEKKIGIAIEEDMHVTAKQISMCGNRW